MVVAGRPGRGGGPRSRRRGRGWPHWARPGSRRPAGRPAPRGPCSRPAAARCPPCPPAAGRPSPRGRPSSRSPRTRRCPGLGAAEPSETTPRTTRGPAARWGKRPGPGRAREPHLLPPAPRSRSSGPGPGEAGGGLVREGGVARPRALGRPPAPPCPSAPRLLSRPLTRRPRVLGPHLQAPGALLRGTHVGVPT